MNPPPPYLLFDDARAGAATARLYQNPAEVVVAWQLDEVRPALARVRAGLAEGRHAAGWLAYEAGHAFDPALAASFRRPGGPLLWFGLFDGWEAVTPDQLPSGDGAHLSLPVARIDRADYLAAVATVHEALYAGDYYQANLTFQNDLVAVGSPLAVHARLRGRSAAGWGGVVAMGGSAGDRWIVSESPEQFFTIRGRTVEARPMKGTAPRRADPDSDAAEAAALAADDKQRAENLMIVDLMRNDLARVAVPGSVAVPDLFAVETYPTVHQLVSRIVATLAEGVDAVAVLETIFPCGSVTGAPKIAAIEALRRLEPEPRGAYTGSLGWIEPPGADGAHIRPGDAAFNVMIRSITGRHGSAAARLGLGSGLVVDSVARDEWAECRIKGEFVTAGQAQFDLIETMRFDPHDGIVALDRHLDRLGTAADDLGFAFDRHAARNELQAATFARGDAAMVRLLLARSGVMAIEVKPFDERLDPPVGVSIAPLPVASDDFRLRYKTTDRRFYDEARRANPGWETVFVDSLGRVTEGSRTSIFVERGGVLVTPPLALGIIPGVLRGLLIDEGKAVEGELTPADLADGFLVGNSARGLIEARLL